MYSVDVTTFNNTHRDDACSILCIWLHLFIAFLLLLLEISSFHRKHFHVTKQVTKNIQGTCTYSITSPTSK